VVSLALVLTLAALASGVARLRELVVTLALVLALAALASGGARLRELVVTLTLVLTLRCASWCCLLLVLFLVFAYT
jgi:hypothetical protein